MWPILVQIGPVTLYTYGVLVALAFLTGILLAVRLAPRFQIERAIVWDWAFYVLVGAIVGARLLYLLVEWRHISWHWRDLLDVLIHAGGVFYGGLAGAALVSWWYLRRTGVPLWQAADLAAAPLALGHAIGRLGCFSAGCCYGKPTNVAWAVIFTHPVAGERIGTPLGIPLHPTQLYESVWNLAVFGVLMVLIRRAPAPGNIWWAYVTLYAVGRFFIEFYRDDPRGEWWVFSTSQWIALVALGMALGWWFRRRTLQGVQDSVRASS